MAKIISKGDAISIYSRVSSLQGFLSDGKKSEPQRVAGAAQCLGELYKHFGRRITSGLLETTMIATKLIKFYEEFVRQEALYMLQNALEGSGGSAASSAYTEAFRLVMRFAIGDKSFVVRIAAARCLKAFANIGGPGLGVVELENSASFCVKAGLLFPVLCDAYDLVFFLPVIDLNLLNSLVKIALEDPVSSVRDAFSEALGSLLALGMSPEAQVQPRGKGPVPPAKKLEGFLQRHLALPFAKASGARSKDVRVGLTLSWVFFLQAIHLKYQHPESELQTFALQVMDVLRADTSVDAHALACVLYILRVGVTDQMMEPTQRSFLVFLGKQLQSPDASPSMKISALCTLSYTLKSLGEVDSTITDLTEEFDTQLVRGNIRDDMAGPLVVSGGDSSERGVLDVSFLIQPLQIRFLVSEEGEGSDPFEPSRWVIKMVSSFRNMVGVSCEGYENEMMNLFEALERDRIQVNRKTPSRSGGKMLRELKGLESTINYNGSVSTSRRGRRGGRALDSC
ncbi:HEAT repeat-containing protein 5B [Morella rubra]|uniref:HEAT repeat-containing protein 5B n=1 Tax=Morella rubra TaxID=262757 RepID=A0A6A1VH40_9ROSI|nr:HEAT repeat-containing protein 5B [Morella rubra]